MAPKGVDVSAMMERLRRVWFLAVGLSLRGPMPVDRGQGRDIDSLLIEPRGAKTCRRNVMALSSAVVVAVLAGDLEDLAVFGVTPHAERGRCVLAISVVVTQLYLYASRYFQTWERGHIHQGPSSHGGEGWSEIPIRGLRGGVYHRQLSDVFSGWMSFLLTVASWCCLARWIA